MPGGSWHLCFLAQSKLETIPSVRIFDGSLLTLEDFALMADATGIDRVGQNVVQLSAGH